jgi:ATP-dependent Clp protease adaptor protein ClpS
MTASATRFCRQSAPAAPEIEKQAVTRDLSEQAPGWYVIVWNDHINTMTFVSRIFQKVLGFNKDKAHFHMMEVHVQGKSCVAKESREKAEFYWEQLQGYGLRTTLQKAD